MNNKFLIFLIIIFFFSCKGKIENKEVNLKGFKYVSVSLDNFKDNNYSASKNLKDIEYVPLESNSDIVIGSINKLIVTTRGIYIYDKLSNAIFVFNLGGKFKYKIDRKGTGPGEYVNIINFTVDQHNDDIYIHDDRGLKILKFDSSGHFVMSNKTDFLFRDFIAFNGHLGLYAGFWPNQLAFDGSNDLFRYVVKNFDSNKISYSSMKFNYNESLLRIVGLSYYFNTNGDNRILFERTSSCIYNISNSGELSPKYYADFGDFKLPEITYGMNGEDMTKYDQEFSSGKYGYLTNVIETPSSISVSFSFKKLIGNCFYSKQKKTSFSVLGFWINDLDNVSLPFPMTALGDIYYSSVNAYEFKSYFKNNNKISKRLIMLNKGIKELDNPIIIKYSLR